ncbi:MAG: hypothetical protein HW421_2783 [Ignavibacteria bacterium]|nr:hypothetical protein [Ignavibacteria bacterium]
MFSKLFENSETAQILAIIGMFVFIITFVVTIIWAIKLSKNYLSYMGQLPLEPEQIKENKSIKE